MGRAYPQRRRTIRGEDSEVFISLDVAKVHHAVPWQSRKLAGATRSVARLEKRHARLHSCYEAGPTGLWGLTGN